MSSGDFRFVLQTRIFVGLIILDLFLKARIFVNFVQAARNWCDGFPQTNEVHFEKEQKPATEKISDLQNVHFRGVPPVASLLDSRLNVDLEDDGLTHHPLEMREVFGEEQDESEDQWH